MHIHELTNLYLKQANDIWKGFSSIDGSLSECMLHAMIYDLRRKWDQQQTHQHHNKHAQLMI